MCRMCPVSLKSVQKVSHSLRFGQHIQLPYAARECDRHQTMLPSLIIIVFFVAWVRGLTCLALNPALPCVVGKQHIPVIRQFCSANNARLEVSGKTKLRLVDLSACGLVASLIGDVPMHPLDTLKTYQQSSSTSFTHMYDYQPDHAFLLDRYCGWLNTIYKVNICLRRNTGLLQWSRSLLDRRRSQRGSEIRHL